MISFFMILNFHNFAGSFSVSTDCFLKLIFEDEMGTYMKITIILFITIAFVSVTLPHVLQLHQCHNFDAEFSKITYGQRLLGDIFQNLTSLSLRECLTKCLYHLGCLSVNYNRYNSTCEILRNTIQRNTPDRVILSSDDSRWNHFETNYDRKAVRFGFFAA